jgi:stress-induced morphogen
MDPNLLKETIESHLSGSSVEIKDFTGTGDHFEATVICPAFEGKSRIQQHQMVMNCLGEFFKGPLHAFTLKTYVRPQ